MSVITKEIRLIMADSESNHNKTWEGYLYDDGRFVSKFGRVGYDLQEKDYGCVGESFFLKKQKEKERKGYVILKTVSQNGRSTETAVSNLHEIARKQIQTTKPELQKLIDRLVQYNIHKITSSTQITYNAQTGLFSTPLGIVTPEGINEARLLLVDLQEFIKGADYKSKKFIKALNSYLMLVPQNIGMKFQPEKIFPDLDAVKAQSSILDSLDASYKALSTPVQDGVKTIEEKIFEVNLDILSENQERKRISDFFYNTKKSMHGYGHIKIVEIYSIDISNMTKNFLAEKKPVVEVFHGTSGCNVLSVLKCGLKISPPSTAAIAGRLNGNGLYGAISSSKSLGYTFNKWGQGGTDSGWLMVCDFAMGSIFEPTTYGCNGPKGHDSVWAKANKTGLNHDELVVFNERQAKVKYLLEVK